MTHLRRFFAYATGRAFAAEVLVVFGILSMPGDAAAQASNATMVGNVRDESGGAVPGATVTLHEMRTNISRTAVSNEAGNYTFTNLAPGVYRVEGELVGFRKFSRDNVDVNVNTTVRVDIALTVGELEESVTVTGEAPMLQTDRTDTGRIIESTQITEMPLAFNRSYQGMLVTVPGATRPFRPHSEFYNAQDSLSSTGQWPEPGTECRETRRHGQRRQPDVPDSFGRGDRNRRGHHQQLRRGVRGGRRRRDQRHAEIRHEQPVRIALQLRQHRGDDVEESLLVV